MFKILIVDDERIEREGIRFLIETNQLGLKIAEAENGGKAMEYLQVNDVDILFTDIKMPFMDGLELSEKAKKVNPDLKIVIFSAFGEFDYARKAIQNSVMSYILKPIDIAEFLQLMERLIQACAQELAQKKLSDEIFKGYLNDREHLKSRALYDLINDVDAGGHSTWKLADAGISFHGMMLLMLVSIRGKLFDTKNEELQRRIRELMQCSFEYLNIDERQSLLFLYGFEEAPGHDVLESMGQHIRQCILEDYGQPCHVLIGNPVSGPEELSGEYNLIEQALDYCFYYEDGAVLFTGNAVQNGCWDKMNDRLLSDIDVSIDAKDFSYTADMVEKLFTTFRQNAALSPVFVKYQCTNILGKIHETFGMDYISDFSREIESVFDINDLSVLKKLILEKLALASQKNVGRSGDTIKRVVRDVMELITNEYRKDLSLEHIAQRVFMTPSYVSYLFKKETGMTPIKYITQFRMEKARILLLNTNMKIVDISESLGYTSVSYFCMLFRNKYGTSPSRLREERETR